MKPLLLAALLLGAACGVESDLYFDPVAVEEITAAQFYLELGNAKGQLRETSARLGKPIRFHPDGQPEEVLWADDLERRWLAVRDRHWAPSVLASVGRQKQVIPVKAEQQVDPVYQRTLTFVLPVMKDTAVNPIVYVLSMHKDEAAAQDFGVLADSVQVFYFLATPEELQRRRWRSMSFFEVP